MKLRHTLLILALLLLPVAHGINQPVVQASGDVVLASGTVTLANTKLSLADSYAFFDFGTDMTMWQGEEIEICPATAASKHYCIRGLVSTVGTGETLGGEAITNPSFDSNIDGWSTYEATIASIAGGETNNCLESTKISFPSSVYQRLSTVVAGYLVKISGYVKSGSSGDQTVILEINNGSSPHYASYSTTSSGSWVQLTAYGTSGITNPYFGMQRTTGGAGTILWDTVSAKQVTAPSSTGHWIKKSAASSTNGDAWGYKHASFLANDSAGYWWRIIQARPSGTYIDGNASIASSNIRLATNDGGSMIEIVGKDLSAYSGVDAYTPPRTNLQLHLKADSGCYTDAGKTSACTNDGDKAYTWADQSGNGNDAVQATEGYRPLYKTSIVGSLPAIRFDGTDDVMQTAAFAAPLSQPVTVYIAIQPTVPAASKWFYDGIADGYRMSMYFNSSELNSIYSGSEITSRKAWSGNRRIYTTVFNSTASSGYRDGAFHLSGSSGTNTLTGLTLASIYNAGSTYCLNGDIYEILIYNTAHNDATRSRIERYLAGKWGITSYQPTYAGTSPAKYLMCLYSSGGTACGYMGAQGGGIALESDLLSGWDFTSGWSGATCAATVTDANTFTLSAASGCIDKTYSALDTGKLYYATLDGTPSAGTLSLRGNSSDPIWCTGNSCTGYGTATTTTNDKVLVYNASGGIGATSDITSMTLQPVTDISQSGVHLHSTPNAYDRKMARVDSGFDPNAVTSYKIFQVGNSGYDLDVILQEDMQPIWGNEGATIYMQQEG